MTQTGDVTSKNAITFVVSGQRQAPDAAGIGVITGGPAPSPIGGRVKETVRVGTRRAAGGLERLSARADRDVVAIHIANGPTLYLHPEHARELLQAQTAASLRSSDSSLSADEVRVPEALAWPASRPSAPARSEPTDLRGQVVVSAVDIITDLVLGEAAKLAAGALAALVDRQVDEALYRLDPRALVGLAGTGKRESIPAGGAPALVLVHGTFTDTQGSFGKLWKEHPSRVAELFGHYGGRVYALDHRTLGVSPIENALTLVRAIEGTATLDLLTHSRGGLVGEVLERVGTRRVDEAELALFTPAEQEALRELSERMHRNGAPIRVRRMLRVACPARGTLLASKRLDAYVSVLKWSLELAGVPVVPAVLDFLAEVAAQRHEPDELPGLAALVPDSALVTWLNRADVVGGGQLRVLAGDSDGDSITSWVKTLLADAIFWTDNDLVVQTRSMYGGVPRGRDSASFVLDAGGKVNHFNYFANASSAAAVVVGLTQEAPAGFRAIGPLSWAGEDSSGLRARLASASDGRPASNKPALFLLPGILGSHLKVGGRRVWLHWRIAGGFEQLAYRPGVLPVVEADAPIEAFYEELIEFLSDSHEVIPFAFDWRIPLEDEARRLASAVSRALDERITSAQPVRLLAHSMGGLLARTMMLEREDVWLRMLASSGSRLVMLGTPNGGSFAPMQVLSCDDDFGSLLSLVGMPLRAKVARQYMAEMPGLLQLQAGLTDSQWQLGKHETWQKLADDDAAFIRALSFWHRLPMQLATYEWGVPSQAVLDRARRLRERLDEQRNSTLSQFASRLSLVVGHAEETPVGYTWGDTGLDYLTADDGDGRVARNSALLPGVRTWRVPCAHSDLPKRREAFRGYLELLERGDTQQIDALAGVRARIDGVAAPALETRPLGRSRPSRAGLIFTPPDRATALLAPPALAGSAAPRPARVPALRVSVQHGNLAFVRQPLMVGHYRSLALTGTERAVDRLLDQALENSLRVGRYPSLPGTEQVFVNRKPRSEDPLQAPRPQGIIVIGLGEEGRLETSALAQGVAQGAIAWLQRLSEEPGGAPVHIELAATLIGSGGLGISPGGSARAIAQGVVEANRRLAQSGVAVVTHLVLTELYLSRASEAWRELRLLAQATPFELSLSPEIQSGLGGLKRPLDTEYRGADYDLIRVLGSDTEIEYTIDTRRARSDVRRQPIQQKLITDLAQNAAAHQSQDAQLGRTLFQLLVPREVEPFLGGDEPVVLELDERTAPLPWEMLDMESARPTNGPSEPWAIRTQLIRKLRAPVVREIAPDASTEDHVLIIGNPLAHERYPSLPGADAEARVVVERFGRDREARQVVRLIERDDARTIINALFQHRYRIVHVAGHGEPGAHGGVVLSNGIFLGVAEIQAMRIIPELVFVNCCFSAAGDQPLHPSKRGAFAASLADALIQIGVRCVVAAGWAVADDAAKAFANTFYARLLEGGNFCSAVVAARRAARLLGGNTWAAYQCYGDPSWTYRSSVGSDIPEPSTPSDEYAGIASSSALVLALEALAARSAYGGSDNAGRRVLDDVRYLEQQFAPRWGHIGSVSEGFAAAYASAGDNDNAIRCYQRALGAEDGSASLRANEQLANLRVLRAFDRVRKARDEPTDPPTLARALQDAKADIRKSIKELQRLRSLQETSERLSLLGSAYKRLSLVESLLDNQVAARTAIKWMTMWYCRAEQKARAEQAPDLFYPAQNRLLCELVLRAGDPSWQGFERGDVAAIEHSLREKIARDPDFWSVAGRTELHFYDAASRGKLDENHLQAIKSEFQDLHTRVPATGKWRSLLDQLDFVLHGSKSCTGKELPGAAEIRNLIASFVGKQ